jgi:hypothetical protein
MLNLNPKIRNVIIALIISVGAACLAAWNGQSTWHVAVGAAIAAAITAITGYLTPQAGWAPAPPAPVVTKP